MLDLSSVNIQLEQNSNDRGVQVSHSCSTDAIVHYPSNWVLCEEDHEDPDLVNWYSKCADYGHAHLLINQVS